MYFMVSFPLLCQMFCDYNKLPKCAVILERMDYGTLFHTKLIIRVMFLRKEIKNC